MKKYIITLLLFLTAICLHAQQGGQVSPKASGGGMSPQVEGGKKHIKDCPEPMTEATFKEQLDLLPFVTKGKLLFTKNIVMANCLSAPQLLRLLNTLEADEEKLEVALMAIKHSHEPHNVYLAAEALTKYEHKTRLYAGVNELLQRDGVAAVINFRQANKSNTRSETPVPPVPASDAPIPVPAPRSEKIVQTPVNAEPDMQEMAIKAAPAPPKPATYSGAKGCTAPLEEVVFQTALDKLKGTTYESQRRNQLITIVQSGCLSVQQIRQLMEVCDFDKTRLDFAKKAADHVFDPDNYAKVAEGLSFNANRKALDEYLKLRK